MNPTLDRWLDAIKVAVIAVATTVALASATGDVVVAGAAAVGGLAATWLVSPWGRVGRHTPHAVARERARGADDLVVYWRPGCSVAMSLLTRLSQQERDRMTWVNVVRDPDAAAFVRARREGDMVTPTAVDGRGRLVEATPEALRERLAAT